MVTIGVDFDCFLLGKPHQKPVKIPPYGDPGASYRYTSYLTTHIIQTAELILCCTKQEESQTSNNSVIVYLILQSYT